MNKQAGNGFLELEVTDFGPIVEAKIDLRPLTVFVGPSNTGKSYLAILIYALHRVFGGDSRHTRGGLRMGFPFRLGNKRLSEASADALLEVAGSLGNNSEMQDQGSIVLPPSAADALRSRFDELADALSNEIRRCFGVGDSRALLRKGRASSSRVVMRRRVSDHVNLAEHTVSLARKPEFRTTVPPDVPIPVNFGARDGMDRLLLRYRLLYADEEKQDVSHRNYVAMEFLSSVAAMVLPSLVGPSALASILPAR